MIVALTGGIGCGKSTASALFSELGWSVLDADRICHEMYREQTEYLRTTFEQRWGKGSVGDDVNVINREHIAKIVFSDASELKWLNSVFHPLIKTHIDEAAQSGDDVLVDIPLLYEAGWEDSFDSVIAVWSSKSTQRARLQQRGLSAQDISQRIESQLEADKKLELADYGLINNSDITQLKEQCIYLNNQLRTR